LRRKLEIISVGRKQMNKKLENSTQAKRVIECPCGFWEELSINDPRWHSHSCTWLENKGDEAIYRCPDCNKILSSKTVEME
jgi:DNA-directed RNA polymerase subunit RPC12/RpoP